MKFKEYKVGDVVFDAQKVYVDPNNLPEDIVLRFKYNIPCDVNTGEPLDYNKLVDSLPQPPIDYANVFQGIKAATVDIEVFKKWWLVVLSDVNGVHIFRPDSLQGSFRALKYHITSNCDFIMGYNIKGFDSVIMQMIIEGCTEEQIYEATQDIVVRNEKAIDVLHKYCKKWFEFGIAELIPTKESGDESVALKFVEAHTGEQVFECRIGFDKEDLTEEDKQEIIKYCKNDVIMTEKVVFPARKAAVEADIALAKMCQDINGKSWVQHLYKSSNGKSALILGSTGNPIIEDEWDNVEFIKDLARKFRPESEEHKRIYLWFINQCKYMDTFAIQNNYDNKAIRLQAKAGKKTLELENGLVLTFGMGGQHGAFPRYIKCEVVYDSDVSSMYPSIMIIYDCVSRQAKYPEKLQQMRDERVAMKTSDEKGAAARKIILVSMYGAMGNPGGPLYDPRNLRRVCITGQLALLKLIEMMQPYANIFNANTDGIFWTLKEGASWETVKDIHAKWEDITGLELEINGTTKNGFITKEKTIANTWDSAAPFAEMYQFNVNNYILVKDKGSAPTDYKIEHKGAATSTWAGPFSRGKVKLVNYDNAVVKEAISNYLVFGTPMEQTIRNCTDPRKFMFLAKSGIQILENGKPIPEKILRYGWVKENGSTFQRQNEKSPVTLPNATGAVLFHDNMNELKDQTKALIIADLDIERYIKHAESKLTGLLHDKTHYESTFERFLTTYPYWSPVQDNGNFPVYRTNESHKWQPYDGSFPVCMLPMGNVWGIDIDDCLFDTDVEAENLVELQTPRGLRYINKELLDWVKKLDIYTEVSAGGHGLHCIATANCSDITKKKGDPFIAGYEVELFNTSQKNHSITITGLHIDGFSWEVKQKTAIIKNLLNTLEDRAVNVDFQCTNNLTETQRNILWIKAIDKAVCKVQDKEHPEHRYIAFRDCIYRLKKAGFSSNQIKAAAHRLFTECDYMAVEHQQNRANLIKMI